MPGFAPFPPLLTGFCEKTAVFRRKKRIFTTAEDDRKWQNWGGGKEAPACYRLWHGGGGEKTPVLPPAGECPSPGKSGTTEHRDEQIRTNQILEVRI
jgi:hypothetical protein